MSKVLALSFILFVTVLRVTTAGQYKFFKEIAIGGEVSATGVVSKEPGASPQGCDCILDER
jgi:hypothetical protein